MKKLLHVIFARAKPDPTTYLPTGESMYLAQRCRAICERTRRYGWERRLPRTGGRTPI